MSAYVAPRLFAMEQTATTSDDYYTPAWVFEQMGIEFDLDVASPPGGIAWIPARRYFTQADDGLTMPWTGRVWMNPPYSNPTPWVTKFVAHGHGVALLPFSKARWFYQLWAAAGAICGPDRGGSWKFASERSISFPVFFAAFGDECVEAISHLGAVRTLAPPLSPPPAA